MSASLCASFSSPSRIARDRFAWHTDWSPVNAFPVPTMPKQSPVSCAARSPAKTTPARAPSTGTRRLTTCPTCMPNLARHATTTSATVTCSRSVGRLILPDRWRRSESSCSPRKALRHSRSGSSAIGMQ